VQQIDDLVNFHRMHRKSRINNKELHNFQEIMRPVLVRIGEGDICWDTQYLSS
jgi:hypothetical protein